MFWREQIGRACFGIRSGLIRKAGPRDVRKWRGAARRLQFEVLEDRQLLSFVPPPIPVTPTNPVQTVRVIVLNYEPTVPSRDNQTLWQIFGWQDPRQLAAGFLADVEAASGGAIDYEIVDWRDLNEFPIFTDGFRYTADQYVQNRLTNTGWNNSPADFYVIAQQQGLAELVNNNVVDEIWMFGDHFFNLLGEAWMAGPASFFINGPSFPNFPVDRAVAGFGFSYERGVAEMLHNLGHRTENHGSRAYGGWNIVNPVTPWDYFTANVGQTNRATFGVGSTHFPFNGMAHYDYTNTATVDTYADDFVFNFPNHTYAAEPMSRDAWGDLGVGDWHRGYQKWFFGHVPRGAGTAPDGRQNNWYKYIYDFNSYRPTTGLPRDNEAILGAPPLTGSGGGTYSFTLRYYDVQGIDAATLDGGDVLVTGPNGFSQLASLVEIGPQRDTTAGTAQTVRYAVSGPGGMWDAADSGTYVVSLRASQVRDVNGSFLPATTLGTFQVSVTTAAPDAVVPTAALVDAPVAMPAASSTSFSVRYSDDRAIDIRSVNFGDVRIVGPNNFVQTAAFYGLDSNANGPMRVATYFVTPPGGRWDGSDNGTYTIELVAGQVFDTAGNAVAPGVLGNFVVDVPVPETRPRADMTELNASDWLAWAQAAAASASDDTAVKVLGDGSVRFDTNGGFDTYLRYEPAVGTMWDLSEATQFYFHIRAQNPSPVGFQVEPIVRFIDVDGDVMEFRYYRNGSPYPLWNDARGVWRPNAIPIKSTSQPATGWRGTAIGTPDWTRMRTVEIHADTWDAGFTLWFDRVGFNLPVRVTSATFEAGGPPRHRVTLAFDESIGATLEAADVQIRNLQSQESIPTGSMEIAAPDGLRREIRFPGYVNGVLPNGVYELSLAKEAVADAAGNMLGADFAFGFAVLNSDYNGDGSVGAADYVVWRRTVGTTGDLRADGDGSGVVDEGDYGAWRADFGMTLPAPTASTTSTGVAALAEPLASAADSLNRDVPRSASGGNVRLRETVAPSGARLQRDAALAAWVASRRTNDTSHGDSIEAIAARESRADALKARRDVFDSLFEKLAVGFY